MPPGDEPQPGGQPPDNSPMISSSITKAIVDARNAYLAANLGALIERMSETQQNLFRQALVQQCVRLLEPLMPPEEKDVGEYAGIRFARQWLADPASAEIDRWVIHAQADIWDGGVRNHDYGDEVLAPIFVAAAKDLLYAANCATRTARYAAQYMIHNGVGGDQITEVDERDAAKRWQLEAAWAILQGKEPPPPVDAALSDAARLYRAGNWGLLALLMNSAQQVRFKQSVVRQAVHYAEDVLPPEDQDRGERMLLGVSRRWLDSPGVESLQAIIDTLAIPIPKLARPSHAHDVFHAAYDAARAAAQPDSHEAVRRAFDAAFSATMAMGLHGRDFTEARKSVWRWQVEAAWVTLHDQDPPPLNRLRMDNGIPPE